MKKLIQDLAKTGDEIYAKICEVISVDVDEKTADLHPLDGTANIDDAYLMVDDENGGVFNEPEIGSLVAVVFVTKQISIVISTSQLKQYKIEISKSIFQMDATGFLFQKENETLKILMTDLITAIKNMKFTTNTGSTILLVNLPEFISVENRFKNFLK